LCGNSTLNKIVNNLKKRLYDFVPQDRWIKEWEASSIKEHRGLVAAIEKGDLQESLHFIHNVHWSFEVQEKFIRRYYFNT
jgi:DNA-binding FadR family transcriptional regulator